MKTLKKPLIAIMAILILSAYFAPVYLNFDSAIMLKKKEVEVRKKVHKLKKH